MAFFIPNYLDITNESELLDIIQEVQFENYKIKEIEIEIGKLRNKFFKNYNSSSKINTDPLIEKISTLFEQAFGFYSFQLSVDQSNLPNAYTVPMSSKIDSWNYKKCVKKTNQGLQFTPAAKVNIMAVITKGLLLDQKYNDKEIVAILLHEIGHNFSDSINNTLGIFSNFKKILLIPYIFTNPANSTNIGRGIATKMVKNMRNNHKAMVDCYNATRLIISSIEYVCLNVTTFISANPFALSNKLNSIIKYMLKNPVQLILDQIFSFFGKKDEYTSDSFVTMYGYGTDLSTALLKVERHNLPVDEIFKSTNIGAIYYALFKESIDFFNMILVDNHPAASKRLLNILNTLEKEYDKDYINPKLKKETKKEIDEIRELINDEIKNNSFDGNFWRVRWNKFILSRKQSKSPKDKMIEDILNKIESLEDN